MMLWGQQFLLQGVPQDQVMDRVLEAQKIAGSQIMGITVLGALVGALLMGYLSDRLGRFKAVCFSSGLASAVYLGMFTVDDPFSAYSKGLLFLMGIAELSAFISSQVLVAQQSPPHLRGAVTGFFGAAGAAGMLVATALGGYLFKNVGYSAPFVGFGLFNLAVFIWSIIVVRNVSQTSTPAPPAIID